MFSITFVTIGVNICTHGLQHAYKVCTFYIKTHDEYKFTASASDKDHKITKIHHFVA